MEFLTQNRCALLLELLGAARMGRAGD